jgi:hypothetical protein
VPARDYPEPACFFHESLYETVGGIGRGLHCVLDTELWYRMLRTAPHWGHFNRILGAFRVHPSSKGQSWNSAYAREHDFLSVGTQSSQTAASGLVLADSHASRIVAPRFRMNARDYLLSLRVRGQRLRDVRWPKAHGAAG